jgi:hypothetical protein
VILAKQIEDPWPIYEKLLDQEFVLLEPHLDEVKANRLKNEIWELSQ